MTVYIWREALLRRGIPGLTGLWDGRLQGLAGWLGRIEDGALHVREGDGIPGDVSFVVLHGTWGRYVEDQWNVSRHIRIVGLPGSKIMRPIYIQEGGFLELHGVEIAAHFAVGQDGQCVITNCTVSYDPGYAGADAISILGDGCLLLDVRSVADSATGYMISVKGSHNRIVACDARGYSQGIVDSGTGNQLVGNIT